MSIEDLLKSLQQDYLAALPEKIATIREQVHKRSATDLRDSFHKLKGTGRTYGLPEISELAAAVEYICLHNPEAAIELAEQAASILEDIVNARHGNTGFALASDPRYQKICSALQP